jgi:hypothetical protein
MRIAVVVTMILAAACGDSNGPRAPASVALFASPSFVEYDTANYRAEASQLEFTIRSFGIRVAPVVAHDSTTLAGAFGQHRVLIIPELERAELADSLSPGAIAAVRHFVDSGGGTLIFSSDYFGRGLSVVETLFGYAIRTGFYNDTYQLSSGAAGTPFAGGAVRIWDNDATYTIDPATLPSHAKIAYQGADGSVAVATIPQGRGMIVLLSYDWYNAAPHGSQDGGWVEVLRRALRN